MRQGRALVVAICAACAISALPAPARAQATWPRKIRDIRVFGNTKTDSRTVIDLAGIARGEDFTPDQIETIQRKLLHSELFSEVTLFYEPLADGIRINIYARDKFAWFVAPTFSAARGNVGGGLAFGHTNLFGRNKKLLVYAGLMTSDSRLMLVYLDPAVAGSRVFFRVDMGLVRSVVDEFNLDLDNAANLSSPELFRRTPVWQGGSGLLLGANLPYHLRGALGYRLQYIAMEKTCLMPSCSNGDISLISPLAQTGVDPPGSDERREAFLHAEIGYDGLVNTWGLKSGTLVNMAYDVAQRGLGSRYEFHKIGFQVKKGIRFFEEHNLILRGGVGWGIHLPFSEEFEAGGSALRGFLFRQFRGDTSVDGHIEYYIPLLWAMQTAFRGLLFYDTQALWFEDLPPFTMSPGGTYMAHYPDGTLRSFLPEVNKLGQTHAPSFGFDRSHWHNGVGAGLRLYLKSINIPLLGFDFGYGLESKEVRFYVALGMVE